MSLVFLRYNLHMNKNIYTIITSVFLFTVIVTAFLQFNTHISINNLITGNEKLLQQGAINVRIKELQSNIDNVEHIVSTAIIKNKVDSTVILQHHINNVNTTLEQLNVFTTDKDVQPLYIKLKKLVQHKMQLNASAYTVINTYKAMAEELVRGSKNDILTDSIHIVTGSIDILHKQHTNELITKADNNGQKAKMLGMIMALLTLLASCIGFVFGISKLKRQGELIEQLNTSEKKALEAAAVKENFLANMSHEIRTPMNAIVGFTNLLKTQPLDEQSTEYVKTISTSSKSLLAIVNDILDLSKIEAGKLRIEKAPFHILNLTEELSHLFKNKIAEKKLYFNIKVAKETPEVLEGDYNRLLQILINLVSNAIKFTETGGISIHFSNNEVINNRTNLFVTVSDTGLGMSQQDVEKIFDRFYQVEDSITKKQQGTGLGLSIVKELIDLQQGTIDMVSTVHKGTAINISIPYGIPTHTYELDLYEQEQKNSTQQPILAKVLIVEDNEVNQKLLVHLCKRWGLTYDMAFNGSICIEFIKANTYDLILMDMQMPGIDGYLATQIIRNDLKINTPIIAMTAHAMDGEREKCIALGMNDYISKPIDYRLLYSLIKQWTNNTYQHIDINTEVTQQAETTFKYINLTYLKEVSLGDADYEKMVTKHFLDMVPEAIENIKTHWANNNITALKHEAHNFKTTITVMALHDALNPSLDMLEHEELTTDLYTKAITTIEMVCNNALIEAKLFYNSLMVQ